MTQAVAPPEWQQVAVELAAASPRVVRGGDAGASMPDGSQTPREVDERFTIAVARMIYGWIDATFMPAASI